MEIGDRVEIIEDCSHGANFKRGECGEIVNLKEESTGLVVDVMFDESNGFKDISLYVPQEYLKVIK